MKYIPNIKILFSMKKMEFVSKEGFTYFTLVGKLSLLLIIVDDLTGHFGMAIVLVF